MPDPVDAEALAEVLDRHRAASDWKCSCGEELFGGTAAYSWRLYLHHVAVELLALVRDAQAAALREAAVWLRDVAATKHDLLTAEWHESVECTPTQDDECPFWHRHEDGCFTCGLDAAARITTERADRIEGR